MTTRHSTDDVPGQGGSWLATPHDRGIVEYPALAPHLQATTVEGVTVLASETSGFVLSGHECYVDLLPLVDGNRSRHEIAAELSARHAPLAIQSALVALASKGYIVSADHALDSEQAAFWCMLGVTPRYAEERLRASRVRVLGDDRRFLRALDEAGVVVSADDSQLTVVLTDDYLDEEHADTNRRHLASGQPWMPVSTSGVVPAFGPVFEPGTDGACWACLAHRIAANREVRSFLRQAKGHGAGAGHPLATVRPFADAVRGLAVTEIAKWIVGCASGLLRDSMVTVEAYRLERTIHHVMRRPQCATCGDRELYRPDRDIAPVRLRSSPAPIRNSGGVRSVTARETLRKYRRLISPVSGVVSELVRTTEDTDSWLHVYRAGGNLALMSRRLNVLRNSLRSKSCGKGASREQAQASALCEAIERYSGVFHGDEIRRRARFEDFVEGDAILPNDVQLFSDWQLENAEELNRRGFRFNLVPVRFDTAAEMDWTPVWSLTAQRQRYLPTEMLYYAKPLENDGVLYCPPDSNGCASGNTFEEAVLQGFLELVERDAFACWWYNRLVLPEIELESFDDEFFHQARDYYASFNRDLWFLDITHDLGIPVFVAVSRRTDKSAQDIVFCAGAHRDPRVAGMRALCELNQSLSAIRDVREDGSGYGYDDPEALWWWKTQRIEDHPHLEPAPGPARRMTDYPIPEIMDARDEVDTCRAVVENEGMEFLVLDQTRPDIAMPVAKTIVPGMRHFWARYAPGRLFDVPVRLGWQRGPLAETELNPIHVFI